MATSLAASGNWDVHYLGWFGSPIRKDNFPFKVYSTKTENNLPVEADKYGSLSFDTIVEKLLVDMPEDQGKLLVLGIGDVWMQEHMLTSKYRDKLFICSYIPIDGTPLALRFANFFALVDYIIPYTEYGKEAIEECCKSALPFNIDRPYKVIPHGVDTSVFFPVPPEFKKKLQAGLFKKTSDDGMIIGFFSRNQARKRADIALKVIKIYTEGLYITCNICKRLTPYTLNPRTVAYDPVTKCRFCNSSKVKVGDQRRSTKMYFHCDLMNSQKHLIKTGGWDLNYLINRWQLHDRVILNAKLQVGHGVTPKELSQIMNACDIHYLPCIGGGWELTILETGACGIPNITTDISAPPEFCKDFSILVPVGYYETENVTGIERGLIDIGESVQALRTLESEQRRKTLGAAGVQIAQKYEWSKVCQQWLDFLATIDLKKNAPSPKDPIHMRVL